MRTKWKNWPCGMFKPGDIIHTYLLFQYDMIGEHVDLLLLEKDEDRSSYNHEKWLAIRLDDASKMTLYSYDYQRFSNFGTIDCSVALVSRPK